MIENSLEEPGLCRPTHSADAVKNEGADRWVCQSRALRQTVNAHRRHLQRDEKPCPCRINTLHMATAKIHSPHLKRPNRRLNFMIRSISASLFSNRYTVSGEALVSKPRSIFQLETGINVLVIIVEWCGVGWGPDWPRTPSMGQTLVLRNPLI